MIVDLLSDGYNYMLTCRLQTNPLEEHFAKLRQMSGGRFLVSLRKVESSQKILSIKSLIKENLNFWMEDVQPDSKVKTDRSEIITSLSLIHNEMEENELCDESRDVAINVAGYVTRKIMNKVDCVNCLEILQSNKVTSGDVKILSQGGLTEHCEVLANYICSAFSTSDYMKDFLFEKYSNRIKVCALIVLETFLTADNQFMCESHTECGIKCINSTVVNLFLIMSSLLRMVTLEKMKSKHLSRDI